MNEKIRIKFYGIPSDSTSNPSSLSSSTRNSSIPEDESISNRISAMSISSNGSLSEEPPQIINSSTLASLSPSPDEGIHAEEEEEEEEVPKQPPSPPPPTTSSSSTSKKRDPFITFLF